MRRGKQIRPNFFHSTSLLHKLLPINLGACKPTFCFFYTLHLRRKSTMRRCFYHTDLNFVKLDINTMITQAYHISRCSSWKVSSKARIAWAFIILVRIQQGDKKRCHPKLDYRLWHSLRASSPIWTSEASLASEGPRILISGYPVLTALNWPQHWHAISFPLGSQSS